MEHIELNPIEEIEVRITNLQSCIEVITQELNLLLLEKKRLSEHHKIGFISYPENNGKNKARHIKHTSSDKPKS